MLFAFDGTWQADQIGPDDDTTVVRLMKRYEEGETDYRPGIGTKGGQLGRYMAGFFGYGGGRRLKIALKSWEKHGAPELVDVIGYSRGAMVAVKFCHKVEAQVRWLGLIDCVGGFGLVPFNHVDPGYPKTIPENVSKVSHALAANESRMHFPLTRFDADKDDPRVTELWFRGNHTDMNVKHSEWLGSNVLAWMATQAVIAGAPVELEGLPPFRGARDAPLLKQGRFSTHWRRRRILEDDLDHWTMHAPSLPA